MCGHPWTVDGRWVVVAEWLGSKRIVFDPDNGNPWLDLHDCIDYVKRGAG